MKNGRPIETANRPNSHSAIPLDGGAPHPAAMPIGSVIAVAPINNRCNSAARRGDNNRPASNAVWKNTMATDPTAGAPPSCGSTIFANIGWIENSSSAETNRVAA